MDGNAKQTIGPPRGFSLAQSSFKCYWVEIEMVEVCLIKVCRMVNELAESE